MSNNTPWYDTANHVIHQLEEYEWSGYSPSVEFPFPVSPKFMSHFSKIKGGIAPFIGISADDAREQLVSSWNDFEFGHLLTRLLDTYVPNGIVINDTVAWIQIVFAEIDVHYGSQLLVRPPVPSGEFDFPMGNDSCYSELNKALQVFDGMREDFYPGGGDFSSVLGRSYFDTVELEYLDEPETAMAWVGALDFYHSKCGDRLLVNKTGDLGWINPGSRRILKCDCSIREMCESFISQSLTWRVCSDMPKSVVWPFDYREWDATRARSQDKSGENGETAH